MNNHSTVMTLPTVERLWCFDCFHVNMKVNTVICTDSTPTGHSLLETHTNDDTVNNSDKDFG